MRFKAISCSILAAAALAAGCSDTTKARPDRGGRAGGDGGGGNPTPIANTEPAGGAGGGRLGTRDPRCLLDNGSISLMPPRWCASVAADNLGAARHLTVTSAGDVYVATLAGPGTPGGIWALRDADDDGIAEEQVLIHEGDGNGIDYKEGFLYFAENDRVIRFELPAGTLTPAGDPVTVVSGLPIGGDHEHKSIRVSKTGDLYVNLGSASNACQTEDRVPGSPGVDPCPELADRAGVWRFDATGQDQVQDDGVRVATGLRDSSAIALRPRTGDLVAVVGGRDRLAEDWPDLFTEEEARLAPSDELLVVQEGADYGWPYCYFDEARGERVLAPEYGGDGATVGRCAQNLAPDLALPAHGNPVAIEFLRGGKDVGRYRGGALVTFHGSLFDGAPTEREPGYVVGLIPFDANGPSGRMRLFAYDFAGEGRPLPDNAEFRPVGVAQAGDGTIYISDDKQGRIWRIFPAVETPAP